MPFRFTAAASTASISTSPTARHSSGSRPKCHSDLRLQPAQLRYLPHLLQDTQVGVDRNAIPIYGCSQHSFDIYLTYCKTLKWESTEMPFRFTAAASTASISTSPTARHS